MNRAQEFLPSKVPGDVMSDDLAARYMAWMALGGTQVIIPKAFLTILGQTPVFGVVRPVGLAPPKSANMLSLARDMCMAVLTSSPYDCIHHTDYYANKSATLISENGDAELWLRLCSVNNPPPIVPYVVGQRTMSCTLIPSYAPADYATSLVPPIDILPTNFNDSCSADPSSPSHICAGDETGNTFSVLSNENLHPWCVQGRDDTGAQLDDSQHPQAFETWLTTHCLSGQDCNQGVCSGTYPDANCVYPPKCPANPVMDDANGSAALRWAQRGAINAGLAVFLYLNAVTMKTYAVKPPYDECDLLTN
jgi:hypothetical protein